MRHREKGPRLAERPGRGLPVPRFQETGRARRAPAAMDCRPGLGKARQPPGHHLAQARCRSPGPRAGRRQRHGADARAAQRHQAPRGRVARGRHHRRFRQRPLE